MNSQDAKIVTFNGKDYTITSNKKGFYAHELGGLTPISQVTGGKNRLAYRVNRERTAANQYGRYRVAIPYPDFASAQQAIETHSKLVIIR